jgi:hypothetical protein
MDVLCSRMHCSWHPIACALRKTAYHEPAAAFLCLTACHRHRMLGACIDMRHLVVLWWFLWVPTTCTVFCKGIHPVVV